MTFVWLLMEDKIYKVWLKIEVNGKNMGHQVIDLQFDQGIPYAVLEWHKTHEGEAPFARVRLHRECIFSSCPKSLVKLNIFMGFLLFGQINEMFKLFI